MSALAAGARLGTYEILGPLGAGGMGEVYLARDHRLGREVALKVLPPDLARDEERLDRFEREARTVAALTHPNIVTLHAVEQVEGLHFLVMERVTGRSLADLIATGRLPFARILELSVPIADALAAAHEKGIVHRDLKPANVMVDDDGRVKVLDFGLSKSSTVASEIGQQSTHGVTSDGRILGTIPYMAPEQVRGDRVDARTDIFAFGTMLHEMAAGVRPFAGASALDVMSAILRDDPRPLNEARDDLPPRFVRLVTRCLEKDPHRRVQSAIDLHHELQDFAEELRHEPRRAAAAPPSTSAADGQPVTAPTRAFRKWAPIGLGIVALAIAAAALVPRWRSKSSPPGDGHAIESLAVLPFDNMTHDASQDYFVEGMHDALITEIAKLGAVRVTSRNSVMRYKGQTLSLKEVARQLGVDALIEGAVLREGNRVRISAQLILGRTDEHLWAQSYDRNLEDVLALLDGVSRAIAVEVQTRVGPNSNPLQLPEPVAAPRVRPDAYEACLRGHQVLRQMTSATALPQALQYFQQATSLDPGFAQAWSGLGTAAIVSGFFGQMPVADAVPMARQAAERALALDKRDGDAYAVLGYTDLYFDWNFSAALPNLERAIALGLHGMLVRHAYADYLMVTGRFDESLRQVQLGRTDDPTSALAETAVLFHTMATRRYDEVIREGRRALQLFPSLMSAHELVGDALWNQRRYEEAFAELDQSFGADADARRVFDGAYRRSGPNAARRAYADLLVERGQGRGNPFGIATLYAKAGERDRAFEWLDRAFAARTPQLLHLGAQPAFDPVRDDPRFRDLTRRIGIPSATPER